MVEEVQKKWVAALSSGKYKQLKGLMHSRGKHCVLGVLCELHRLSFPKGKREPWTSKGYYGYRISLPPEVQVWAGLPGNPKDDKQEALTDLNDDGFSFKTIAGIIARGLLST